MALQNFLRISELRTDGPVKVKPQDNLACCDGATYDARLDFVVPKDVVANEIWLKLKFSLRLVRRRRWICYDMKLRLKLAPRTIYYCIHKPTLGRVRPHFLRTFPRVL